MGDRASNLARDGYDLARDGYDLARDGFVVFDGDPRVAAWAKAALPVAIEVSQSANERAKWLRHGDTWFVGVDALPNTPSGSIHNTPLAGPWGDMIQPTPTWHRAQASATYPGYPRQDPTDSDAAHRFRVNRASAHVDGLHLEHGRRVVREPHAFILGLPLNNSDACPLVVWRGSHLAMGRALRHAIGAQPVIGADVTDIYKAARARVFETCDRVEVVMKPGQAVLLDRATLHGVAPWSDGMTCPPEGRIIAYFRPEFENPNDWIAA